ncbi:threonine--tRNA ligase [Alicyclobacillus fodiniaquatilis]|uniref:Threonine--tRNA ligase n=1 Tax=Alicyclobacillus fodiniaquatilis TaxID=1661150 RepID=A0ABW4JP23_9BACL
MCSVKVKLPDDKVLEVEQGTTILDVASALRPGLGKKALGGKIDGQLVDVYTPIVRDAEVEIVTADMPEGLHMLRHSTAHLLAQALKRRYGDASVQLGVGPVIESGFYYDVSLPAPISVNDLADIEQIMQEIAQENLPIQREVVTKTQALELFANSALKQELIHELPESEVITLYRQGEFYDLCRGPHVPNTGQLKIFKLQAVAGAYWRGDAKRQMLQRIYGTAFAKRQQLESHLQFVEEAKKRDHRKLGKALELFMFSDEAPGMPFYLPKGLTLRQTLEAYEQDLQMQTGYEEVRTPLLMNQQLWEQSGHFAHYRENMYFTDVEQVKFALKPMNCPGHMLIYKHKLRSYRDLPIRMSENGQVHRHELSGTLNGMMRVRTFTQDDAHIFVRPDQIETEIADIMRLIDQMYGQFGFDYRYELSTRPDNSMGTDEQWEEAELALKTVLDHQALSYHINAGDGAFYGPKIDFHIQDALGRSWQCATIQLDFQMPEKFDLSYMSETSSKCRPVVIHRAIFGSIDRFLGILLEHYAGAFPVWLAPVQVGIVPINERHHAYAAQIQRELTAAGIRSEVDSRNEKIGYRIRQAQLQKLPYLLVIGDAEIEKNQISVRQRGNSEIDVASLDGFKAALLAEIQHKR